MSSKDTDKRFIVANWKCTKTLVQARQWLDDFAKRYRTTEHLQIIVAPPMIWLVQLADQLNGLQLQGVSLAAQDISPFPPGGYTGAIAADMLKGYAEFTLVGHPDRRLYFHETSQDITNKVSEAADAAVTPIICLDKTYAMSQLTSINDVECQNLIVAYCPVENRSSREPEPPEKVEEAVGFISQIPHPSRPVIYGGGITADNTLHYVSIPGLSGVLVGSASHDAHAFADICRAMADS